MLFGQLKPLITDECPFTDLPNSKSKHWAGAGGITAEEMAVRGTSGVSRETLMPSLKGF
jgi:hypothetical protein